MKEFGQILKELRLGKNLSQEALGKILNVSRSSVARYENGLGLPPSDIVESLCTYFNVDKDSTPDHLVFNRTVGLKDSWTKSQK